MLKKILITSLLLLFSCHYYKSKIDIAYILKNCYTLKGKVIILKATYMGWNCPKTCQHPGITRSDTCWVDNSGCIYAKGLSGLNPLRDVGKRYTLTVKVDISKNGVCYLEVEKLLKR